MRKCYVVLMLVFLATPAWAQSLDQRIESFERKYRSMSSGYAYDSTRERMATERRLLNDDRRRPSSMTMTRPDGTVVYLESAGFGAYTGYDFENDEPVMIEEW